MKNIYLGIGTTGLKYSEDDIIKLSIILEEDNVLKDTLEFNMKPRKGRLPSTLNQVALDINGVTIKDLRDFDLPNERAYDVIDFLMKHSDNGKDKLRMISHNLDFDRIFLNNFIEFHTDYSIWSYVSSPNSTHLMGLVPFVEALAGIKFGDYKFKTLCDYYEIAYNYKESMTKAKATRQLTHRLIKSLSWGQSQI